MQNMNIINKNIAIHVINKNWIYIIKKKPFSKNKSCAKMIFSNKQKLYYNFEFQN